MRADGEVRRALAAVVALALLTLAGTAAAQQKGEGGGGRRPAPVVVAPVKLADEVPAFAYTGLIEAAEKALLSAEVSGRVREIRKREGERVLEGQVLAVLENPSLQRELIVLQARVKEIEAQLALERQQARRTEALFRKNLTSAEEYEDAQARLAVTEARLETARAQVAQLEDQLSRMVIESPLAGQIVREELELGQWITPNQPLFEIYSYQRFEIVVGVPGRFMALVPDAGRVKVRVPELERGLEGEIAAVIRHVNEQTGNFTVRVGLRNPERLPLSGMLARVTLPLGQAETVLTVPRDAVVRSRQRTHVVVVSEGQAQVVPVQIEGNLRDRVIVEGKGLRPGQKVVVRGNERLFPGMPVRVTGTLSEDSEETL